VSTHFSLLNGDCRWLTSQENATCSGDRPSPAKRRERNAQTFFTSRRVPFNFGSAATRDPWSVTRQIARVGPGGRSMEAGVESPIQPERKNESYLCAPSRSRCSLPCGNPAYPFRSARRPRPTSRLLLPLRLCCVDSCHQRAERSSSFAVRPCRGKTSPRYLS